MPRLARRRLSALRERPRTRAASLTLPPWWRGRARSATSTRSTLAARPRAARRRRPGRARRAGRRREPAVSWRGRTDCALTCASWIVVRSSRTNDVYAQCTAGMQTHRNDPRTETTTPRDQHSYRACARTPSRSPLAAKRLTNDARDRHREMNPAASKKGPLLPQKSRDRWGLRQRSRPSCAGIDTDQCRRQTGFGSSLSGVRPDFGRMSGGRTK